MWIKQFIVLVLSFTAIQCKTFPQGFQIGSTSPAYNIEGGWVEEVKVAKNHSHRVIAANFYHKFKEDVKAMKDVGFDHYRFSVSWSRIIPNISMTVNQKGLEYYSGLFDELLANNIEPIITLYHGDLPQYLQDLGGFTDPMIVKHFKNYADVLFKAFGDRVKRWITFNEPWTFCVNGYGTGVPQVVSNGVGEYICGHHVLQSHAAAYHLYKNNYKSAQKGTIGITLIVDGKDTQKAQEFRMGWYAHPIFSKQGGYPQIMIDIIGNNSMNEGRNTSRLPTMSDEMKTSLRGSADFFGLNYYTTRLVSEATTQNGISWENDVGLDFMNYTAMTEDHFVDYFSVHDGLHDVLVWIKDNYNNPPVLLTDNGWIMEGELEDFGYFDYSITLLIAISEAINKEKCNVIGYSFWSIIDNFGYSEKFGIFQVNVSQTIDRIPKNSVELMKDVIKMNSLTSNAIKSGPFIGLFISAFIIHKLIN